LEKDRIIFELVGIAQKLKDELFDLKLSGVEAIELLKDDTTRNTEGMTQKRTTQSQKQKLAELKKELSNCMRCGLHKGRQNIVFGVGCENADLVFVGEAPGASEDVLGEPFVGRSGKLLTKMIEAMGLLREQVYICNVVKCRPPENRDPTPDEVKTCEPFLKRQLAIIKPKVIVALGRYACQCLLHSTEPMGEIRGKWAVYDGIELMPTFHPAYLLRSPSKKKVVWEDLQKVMERLNT